MKREIEEPTVKKIVPKLPANRVTLPTPKMSKETQAALDAIDANIRLAWRLAPTIFVD